MPMLSGLVKEVKFVRQYDGTKYENEDDDVKALVLTYDDGRVVTIEPAAVNAMDECLLINERKP